MLNKQQIGVYLTRREDPHFCKWGMNRHLYKRLFCMV